MTPLVIVRPEPGAGATAARARAIGIEARTFPLFEIVPVNWSAPQPGEFDALVLTSANAIRHGGPQLVLLKGLPVHAVGQATAAAARSGGFTVASAGEGGAAAMALPGGLRLLHLAGREHVDIGAAKTIAVYEAREIDHPAVPDAFSDCVIAIHSPRAGRRLAELVSERAGIAIAAISPAAAAACGTGWKGVEAAPRPSDSALLALAVRLCESHPS
jgi:uroporphyrinogen-III synthase